MDQYLELLSEKFPTKEEIITKIINLEAILQLPKGTELFLSDIHGEFPAFDHILRNGSGNLREKIKDLFQDCLSEEEMKRLTIFVAYPEYALATDWYKKQDKTMLIHQLIELLRFTSVKYTRSKVRKALPKEYSYIIEELLYVDDRVQGKKSYVSKIVDQLLEMNEEERFLKKLAQTIQRMVIDHVHVVGDIFDRGTQAAKVMDRLMEIHSIDIQWGNHDILWLGAYCGSETCLLTLLRIAARYNYLFELEKEYALNLRSLCSFATETYQTNPLFTPKNSQDATEREREEMEKIHQALAIMQFKLESHLLKRRPEFEMADRDMLANIDYEKNELFLDGQKYTIHHPCFQTISAQEPDRLTADERRVIDMLLYSFQHSLRMQKHMDFLLEKGRMYLVTNQSILFHGCMPVDEHGEFLSFKLGSETYQGKQLMAFFEEQIRESAKSLKKKEDLATDLIWYAWSGPYSPLFGKSKMATFERYYLAEKETHVEVSNAYYRLRDKEWLSQKVRSEFGVPVYGPVIINGHTPVKVKKGESPIKADGTVFVIDGGLSKAYQRTTGIAGYSLLCNSYGFQIVTHYPFLGIEEQFETANGLAEVKKVIDQQLPRKLNRDTTKGSELQRQIEQLKQLLEYRRS
ncbi:fructose-1,6-bisphosphatase [Enterococcus pernyi]